MMLMAKYTFRDHEFIYFLRLWRLPGLTGKIIDFNIVFRYTNTLKRIVTLTYIEGAYEPLIQKPYFVEIEIGFFFYADTFVQKFKIF